MGANNPDEPFRITHAAERIIDARGLEANNNDLTACTIDNLMFSRNRATGEIKIKHHGRVVLEAHPKVGGMEVPVFDDENKEWIHEFERIERTVGSKKTRGG